MINNLGSKALETKIDDYMDEFVSDYVSTYMSISEDQIETNRKVLEAGFEDFIVPVYENAPFTTIQNRAQVTRSLKAIAGIERIGVRELDRLANEFGPNGEQVFQADNEDSRIRFVGSGWTVSSSVSGKIPFTTTVNDFVEITFYGTGLNFGTYLDVTTRDYRATVDNGVEGSNLQLATASGILAGRNYNACQIVRITSGLALGWHTVKIRMAATGLVASCFEILNERTDLATYPGQGISNGRSNSLSALSTSSFNSGVVGARGARVVKYIENNVLNTSVQEVNAAAAYLTSTDHTNEEIIRRISFREFGAGRADDFSTLTSTASSRAFTLDDGMTTLVGLNARASSIVTEAVSLNGNIGNHVTLTFIGTGLDLVISTDATTRSGDIYIDNALVGTVSKTASSGIETRKICSGLQYGTHTVKLYQPSSIQDTFAILDFIIYQPKKPTVPATSFEVADYNVMANYAVVTNPAVSTVPTGAMRKFGCREAIFVGTWVAPAIDIASFNSGLNIRTVTSGSYVEYSFWGTGVEFRTFFNTAATYSQTYSIDGSTNLSTYTTALVTATTGLTLNPATGVISGTTVGNNPGLIRITNLPLGLHRIRVLSNSVAALYADAFDVITPIHINDPNLKIGSRSIKSVTKFSPEKSQSNAGPDLSKAKAWVVFDGINQFIQRSYNISAILRNAVGQYTIYFEKPFKSDFYTCSYQGTTSQSFISLAGTPTGANPLGKKRDSFTFSTANTSGAVTDAGSNTSVIFFGELSDE